MKARPSTIVLAAVFSALFSAVMLSYCVFPRATEGRSFSSRIADPLAVASAETITIRDAETGNYVELRKERESWFARADGKNAVPADGRKIAALIAALSRERTVRPMRAQAGEKARFTVTIAAANGAIQPEISLYGTDASGGRISFGTARDITALQTDNDLSFCEDASTADWIQHQAFGDIERAASAQRLAYRGGATSLTLGRGNEDFANVMQVLSSMACLDSERPPERNEETLRIEFGDASARTFAFDSLGADYRITENGRSWRISAWSYARLKSALGIGAP